MARCSTPETLVTSSCFILLWWCKSNCRESLIDRLNWVYNCFVLGNNKQHEHKHQPLLQLFSTIFSPGVKITTVPLGPWEAFLLWNLAMQASTLLLRGVSQSAMYTSGFLTFEFVHIPSPTLHKLIQLNLLCCCGGKHPLKWTDSLPFSIFLTKHLVPAKQHITRQMMQAPFLSH